MKMNIKWLSNISLFNFNKKNSKQKFVRSRKRFRTITWKYTKTIGPFASFIYLFNQSIGSGLFDIPSLIDEVGWIPVIFGNFFVCSVAVFCSLMILRAMTMIPKNKNFEQRIEYSAVIKYFMSNEKYRFVSFLYHLGNICNNICGILVISKIIDIFIIKLFGYTILFQVYPEVKITKCSLTLLDAIFNGYYYSSTGNYETVIIAGFTIGYIINAIICIHLSSKGLEETINYQYIVFMIFMSSFLYLSISSTIYLLSQNYIDPPKSINNLKLYNNFILNSINHDPDLIKHYQGFNEIKKLKKKFQQCRNPFVDECIDLREYENFSFSRESYKNDYYDKINKNGNSVKIKKSDNLENSQTNKKNEINFENLRICPFFYLNPLLKKKTYVFHNNIFYFILFRCSNDLKIKNTSNNQYFYFIYKIYSRRNSLNSKVPKYKIKELYTNETFVKKENYQFTNKFYDKYYQNKGKSLNEKNKYFFFKNLYYMISKIEGIKTYCMGKTFANFIDSYGFVSNIPSWGNEITDEVNVSKSIWLTTLFSSIFYFVFGLIFCLNNSFQKINTSVLYIFNFVAVAPKVITGSISMRYDLMNLDICSDKSAFFWGCIAPFLSAWIFSNGIIFSNTFNYISLICGLFCNFLSPAFAYISACESNNYICKNPLRKYTIVNRKKTMFSSCTDIRRALGNIIDNLIDNDKNDQIENENNITKEYYRKYSLDYFENKNEPINYETNDSYFKFVNGEYKLKNGSKDSNEINVPLKRSSTDFKTINNSNIFTNENKDHNSFNESKKETTINNMNQEKKEKKKKGVMFSDELKEYSEENKVKKVSISFEEDTKNIDESKKERKKKKKVVFFSESNIINEEKNPKNNEKFCQLSENKNPTDQKEKLSTKKKLMFSDEIEIYGDDKSEQNKEKKKKGIIFFDEVKKDNEYSNEKKKKKDKEVMFVDEIKVNNTDDAKNIIYTSFEEDTKYVDQNKEIKKKKGVQFSGETKIYDDYTEQNKKKKIVIFSNNIKVCNEDYNKANEQIEKKVILTSNEKKTHNEKNYVKEYHELDISLKDKKCNYENEKERKNFKFKRDIENISEKNYINKGNTNIFINGNITSTVASNLKYEPTLKLSNENYVNNREFETLKEKKNITSIESKNNRNLENIARDIKCNSLNEEIYNEIKNEKKINKSNEKNYLSSNDNINYTNDHTNINQKYFSEKIPKYQIKISNNEFVSETNNESCKNIHNFENKNKVVSNKKEKSNINNKDKIKCEKDEKETSFKNKLNDFKKEKLNEKIDSCVEYKRNFSDSVVNYNVNDLKIEHKENESITKNCSFECHKQVFTRQREKLKSQYKCTISRILENNEKYDNLMKDIESLKYKEQNTNISFDTVINQTLNDEKNTFNSILNKNGNKSNDKIFISEALGNVDFCSESTFCYANDSVMHNLQSIKSYDTYKTTSLENCENTKIKINSIPNEKRNNSFSLIRNNSENNKIIDKIPETKFLEDLILRKRELSESNKENLRKNILMNKKGLTNENDLSNLKFLQKSTSINQNNVIDKLETCYFDDLPSKHNSIDKKREILKIHPSINNNSECIISLNNSKCDLQKDKYDINVYSPQVNSASKLQKNESVKAKEGNFIDKKGIKKDNTLQLNNSNSQDYSSPKTLLPQNNSILKKEMDTLNASNLIKENNINNNTNNKYENNKLFVRQRKKLKSSFHANGDMIIGNSKEAIHKEQINEFRKKISNDSCIYNYYNNYKSSDTLKSDTLKQNCHQMKKEEITKERTDNAKIVNDLRLETPTGNIINLNEVSIKTQNDVVLKSKELSKPIGVPKHKTSYKFKDISKLYGEICETELELYKNKNEKDLELSPFDKNILNKNEDISSKDIDEYIIESTDKTKNESNKNIKLVDKQNENLEKHLLSPETEKPDVIKKIEKIYSELANKIHSENPENSSNEDDDDTNYIDVKSFKIIDNISPVKYYYNAFHRSKILDTKKYEHFYSNNIMIDNKTNLDHLCSIFLFGNPLERNEEYANEKDKGVDNEFNNASNISKNTKLNPPDKFDTLKCEKPKSTSLNSNMHGTNESLNRSFSGNLEKHSEIIKKSVNERNSLQSIKGISLRKSNIKFSTKDEIINYEELNDVIGNDDVNLKKNNSEKIEIMKIRIHVYPSILQKYHVETTYVLLGCLTAFSFVGIITDLLFG